MRVARSDRTNRYYEGRRLNEAAGTYIHARVLSALAGEDFVDGFLLKTVEQ